MDLRDFDTEVLDYEVISTYPGRAGNWFEPAEPEVKEIHIKSILLDLKGYEEIEDVWGISVNDCVLIELNHTDTELPLGIYFEGSVLISKVTPYTYDLELGIKDVFIQYIGPTPPQSQSGRG